MMPAAVRAGEVVPSEGRQLRPPEPAEGARSQEMYLFFSAVPLPAGLRPRAPLTQERLRGRPGGAGAPLTSALSAQPRSRT